MQTGIAKDLSVLSSVLRVLSSVARLSPPRKELGVLSSVLSVLSSLRGVQPISASQGAQRAGLGAQRAELLASKAPSVLSSVLSTLSSVLSTLSSFRGEAHSLCQLVGMLTLCGESTTERGGKLTHGLIGDGRINSQCLVN